MMDTSGQRNQEFSLEHVKLNAYKKSKCRHQAIWYQFRAQEGCSGQTCKLRSYQPMNGFESYGTGQHPLQGEFKENKRPEDLAPEHSNIDEKDEEEPAKETKKYGVSRRRA